MRCYPVMGRLWIYGIDIEKATLRYLQAITPSGGVSGISQPQTQLLIARYLGNSTHGIDSYFTGLWEWLRPLLLQREACHPRIWKT